MELFFFSQLFWRTIFLCCNMIDIPFGTEQVMEGLDRAVMTMKKNEVALLTIAPEYAFGSSESKQDLAVVPPNSTVCCEVELVSFEKVSKSRNDFILL